MRSFEGLQSSALLALSKATIILLTVANMQQSAMFRRWT
jgi:hypothetical protein